MRRARLFAHSLLVTAAVLLAAVLPAGAHERVSAASGSAIVKYLPAGPLSLPTDLQSGQLGGVAVDRDGNLYAGVSRAGSSYIAVFKSDGKFLRSFKTDSRNAPRGELYLAVGPDGNIYVAPQPGVNQAVGVLSPDGTPLRQIGAGAGLAEVGGIAVDGSGNVWVTSRANASVGARDDVVVRLDPQGNVKARLAPLPGHPGATGSMLRGLALDPDGSVWVVTADHAQPLVHLSAAGKRLPGPNPTVLLPTKDSGELRAVAVANGRLYLAGELGHRDLARTALAVLAPSGKIADLIAGGARQVAVSGENVYLNAFVPVAKGGSRSASAINPGAGLGRFTGTVVEPPIGSSAAVTYRPAGASCTPGSAQNDLLVPYVKLPADGGCGVQVSNFTRPCRAGYRVVPGRVFSGGDQVAPNYFYVGEDDREGFLAQVDLPGGQTRTGSLVVEYRCVSGEGRIVSKVFEWKGELELVDPSGTVLDARSGRPVEAAKVRLQYSPRARGPFGKPGLSGISPQLVEEQTGPNGRFGWDVAPGYWRLHVQAFGYRPLVTAAFHVPPEVTGLQLKLAQNPAEQAWLIDPAGRAGRFSLGTRVASASGTSGLRLHVVGGTLRGIVVQSRRFKTAYGIGVGSSLKNLRRAYPPVVRGRKKTVHRPGAYVVKKATFAVKGGRVTAITLGR